MIKPIPFTKLDLEHRETDWQEFVRNAARLGASVDRMTDDDFVKCMWQAGYNAAHGRHCWKERRVDMILGGIVCAIMMVILIGFIALVSAGIHHMFW